MAGRVFALPSAVLLIQALFADSLSLTMNSVGNGAAPKRVVIAGSGVIGTSTAFFLAKDYGVSSTLVDPTGTIAPAASGKAGGFLALDWNDFSSVGPLARRSFGLHQEIADILGASKIQYRRLTCVSIEVGGGSGKPKGRKLDGIEWAQGHNAMASARSLGDESTIAQVHPKKLCEAMWEHVQSLMPDSTLVRGKVVKGVYDENTEAKLIGAELEDGTVVEGDALLYACGPWTADNMFGTKYHSLVVPTAKTLSQCVFFSGFGDPEVYVRPDNTAYCTGFPDPPVRVTEHPGQEEVREDAIDKIQKSVELASSSSEHLASVSQSGGDEQTVKQACYLPSTADGTPMMGSLQGLSNQYVSAGHTCWGILMGPASGESMANLIATGKSDKIDLTPFTPARFGKLSMVPGATGSGRV